MFKKTKYLIIFLALLVLSTGIAVAADVNDTTNDATTITADTTTVSDVQEQAIASESNKITKDNKNLKEDPTLIEVNDDNFDDYFKSTGFENNVNNGDTISFTGDVSRYNNTTYVVDKQINILGNDYTITLNTTSGSYFGNETGSSFIFDNGATGSTITNINFYNTQVIVRNTSNIVFDNIDQTVSNQRIGQGIGTFSIRDGSSYITVENSRFSTTNNQGSSTLVLADAQYCTIENNTITGVDDVGNLLYLTTYNIATTPTEDTNSYNIIQHNTITGPSTPTAICWGIVLSGHDNTVFNNTVNYAGISITTQAINVIDENNYQHQISQDNIIANNTFAGLMYTGSYALVENNTISKKVTAQEGSSLYNNTIFDGVLINGQNVRLMDNNISKTVNITKNNIYLEYNHICGNVKLNSAYNNVTMQNNVFCGVFANSNTPSESNNTPCGSGCTATTCGCQHIQLNSNKNLKEDDDNIIEITRDNVQQYFEIYNEDGELADVSREVGYESYIDSQTARNNQGKTYLLDQSAVTALGRNIISINTRYNISLVGKNNPTISAYDFSTGTNMPLFANFTIRIINDEYGDPGRVSLLYPTNKDIETFGIVENITVNGRWTEKLTDSKEMVSFLAGNPYSTQREHSSGVVRNCNFNLGFISDTINWDERGRPCAVPIYLPGYANDGHIKIENSNINISEIDNDGHFATIWGIYITNNNTEIINNNIYIHGEQYLYSIENTASHTNLSNNNIIVNGTHYTAGIYTTSTNMQNNTIENNNITLYSGYHNPGENGAEEDSGYGIVIEDRMYFGGTYAETSGSAVYNNRIINNNVTTYGHNTYAIEHYGGKNTTITGNNISAYGINPTGIAFTGINSTIENNTIIALAQTNVTGQTVDYFPAISAGLYLQLSLKTEIKNNNITVENGTGIIINRYDNVNITENNITTTDDYGISLNTVKESKVTDNYILARTLKGNDAVKDNNGTDNTIENNQPSDETPKDDVLIYFEPDDEYDNTEDLRVQGEISYGDDEEPLIGEDITITITFSDESQKTYTTTTDEEGFDYAIPASDLIPGEATITLTYAGNENYNPISETYTLTINAVAEPPKETQIVLQVQGPSTMNVSEQKYISGYFALKGSYTGTYVDQITIYDNNEQIATVGPTNNWGTISLQYNATTPGEHNITFKYAGNESYLPTESSVILTVQEPPKETQIVLQVQGPSTMNVSEQKYISGYFALKGSYTGTYVDQITIYDNNEQIATVGPTNNWGTISLQYNATTPGEHNITFKYAGNESYLPTESSVILTVQEPPKEYSLKVETTEFTVGTNTTITASIYYGNEYGEDVASDINKGKVTFKVNGKTLKDENGKVIYAKVVNGAASIENYNIPEDWKENSTIQAVYSGSTEVPKLTSEKQNITITQEELTLTTEDKTAAANSTITLTATLSDNNINTGKIVFKINGKTVKDANGKVLYAKVINGTASVEYTLPENMKVGSYTITAVYTSANYPKLEDTKTLTIN